MSLRTHSRDHARAPRGQRTRRLEKPLATASRISVLPAVSLDGLMAVMAQEGSILRIDVEYLFEDVLVSYNYSFFERNSLESH